MDSDWKISSKEINGINLDNYIAQQRSYNSVVYVHKKYLEEIKPVEEKAQEVKAKKEKKNKQEKNQDKCQQFTSVSIPDNRFKNKSTKNNTVLDQTIKFAKGIVPLVIPPEEDKSNVFYTIKTSKKHKRKEKKPLDSSFERHDLAQEREDPKKIIETFRKVKKESFSVHESVSHSSSNTLEDLNIDQSLCCTFSEVSEKKYYKKDKHHSKKPRHEQKFAISESFDAVATENVGGNARIKIHLMNEKDKHFLSETIKEPVLKAIRNCILELNNNNTNAELPIVQKYMKCNSQKLDNILDKLTFIEKKLESYEKNFGYQENKLDVYEQKLDNYKNKVDSHEVKLDSHEAKLYSHEVKINSYEAKLNSHEKKLDSQMKNQDTHSFQLNPNETKSVAETKSLNQERNIDSQVKKSTREKSQEHEGKRAVHTRLSPSNAKSSTLEELGADLIEMDDEYTSEEELHQELLDRRSKSNVVIELAPKTSNKNKVENLGGGEVPPAVKCTSMGTKLERPNRIPARFCWTDTVRKN